MKLILCKYCHDLIKLNEQDRLCDCGRSGGRYLEDGHHAVMWGKALPVGIDNNTFVQACQYLNFEPEDETGAVLKFIGLEFKAFLINEKECSTIKRISKKDSQLKLF